MMEEQIFLEEKFGVIVFIVVLYLIGMGFFMTVLCMQNIMQISAGLVMQRFKL